MSRFSPVLSGGFFVFALLAGLCCLADLAGTFSKSSDLGAFRPSDPIADERPKAPPAPPEAALESRLVSVSWGHAAIPSLTQFFKPGDSVDVFIATVYRPGRPVRSLDLLTDRTVVAIDPVGGAAPGSDLKSRATLWIRVTQKEAEALALAKVCGYQLIARQAGGAISDPDHENGAGAAILEDQRLFPGKRPNRR